MAKRRSYSVRESREADFLVGYDVMVECRTVEKWEFCTMATFATRKEAEIHARHLMIA